MKYRKENERIREEQKIFHDLMAINPVCNKCQRNNLEDLTLDHIIPRLILENFGVDTKREIIEGNYQVLCILCNNFKGHKLDFSLPKTKEILLKLLERV